MTQEKIAKQAIRLVVVEDHRMIREMLVQLLSAQERIDVVGAAGSIAEAREMVEHKHPHIVVLDMFMPDESSIEWVRNVKQTHSEIKVLFVTNSASEEMALTAISTGAEGYFVTNSSYEYLLDAIMHVVAGDYVFDTEVMASIVRNLAATNSVSVESLFGDRLHSLSSREKEIATLVSRGLTNKEIADATFVTINTVKTHLRRIYQRLGISSRRKLLQVHQIAGQ